MRKVVVVLAVLGMLVGSALAGGLHQRLNGTWVSDIFTCTFDFGSGVYSGVALGDEFEHKLELVKEAGNVVIFLSDGQRIVAQFQEDGTLILAKEGGLPVLLKRASE